MRKTNRLSVLQVKNAAHPATNKAPRLLADGGGLYLQVMPRGTKSWLVRFSFAGKARALGLGSINALTLADARQEAAEIRRQVALGFDPKLERERRVREQVLARSRTFRSCAEELIKALESKHRNKKAHAQWKSSLGTYVYPIMGDVPVSEVSVNMVLAVLNQNGAWLKKNETMRRVRGRIERVLGWAAVMGYRPEGNPARYENFLSEVLPAVSRPRKHHAALHYSKVPGFVRDIVHEPPSISTAALRFVIYTAARTGEVIGARHDEIDLASRLWVIPGARTKSGRVHRVPLTDSALNVLAQLQPRDPSGFVFPGAKNGRPISNMSMLQFMRRRVGGTAVPHGFRSSFRDFCAEKTNAPREIAEAALAHVLENKTEAAYQRGDLLERRRSLMEEWCAYCDGLLSSPGSGKISSGAPEPSGHLG